MVGLSLQGMLPIVFTYTLDALMAKFWEPVPSSQQLATQEQRCIRRMAGAKTFFQRICHIGRQNMLLLHPAAQMCSPLGRRYDGILKTRATKASSDVLSSPNFLSSSSKSRENVYLSTNSRVLYIYFYIETCHGRAPFYTQLDYSAIGNKWQNKKII